MQMKVKQVAYDLHGVGDQNGFIPVNSTQVENLH